MNCRWTGSIAAFALLLGLAGLPGARADVTHDLVQAYLDDLGAVDYTIDPITDDYVASIFPDIAWFSVWFPQYPIVVEPPKGLAESNVFLVVNDTVLYVTSPKELEAVFADALPLVANADEAMDATRTWLRLSEEFSADGYFEFGEPQAEIRPVVNAYTQWYVRGHVRVTDGGRGGIHVNMVFNPLGELASIQESRRVIVGIRPLR
jgi:hypothetical protein